MLPLTDPLSMSPLLLGYHQSVDINKEKRYENTASIDSYTFYLKGLLRVQKTSPILYPQQLQYELVLDRSSLLEWWNHHHSDTPPSIRAYDTVIIELIRVLQKLSSNDIVHSQDQVFKTNPSDKCNPLNTQLSIDHSKVRKDRITSAFLSMDIFNTITTSNEVRHDDTGKHKEMHHIMQRMKLIQNWICTVLRHLKETLPQLQSLHLYNGPTDNATNSRHDFDDTDEVEQELDNNQNDVVHTVLDTHNSDDNDGRNLNFISPRVDISGELLASIIKSSTLQSIIVTRCLNLYDKHDICTLSHSIECHPTLCTLHLLSVRLNPIQEQQFCLDPLLRALSTVTQLESVNLTLMNTRTISQSVPQPIEHLTSAASVRPTAAKTPLVSPQCLQLLVSCPTLKDLSLWECKLSDIHLSAISRALLHGEVCSVTNTSGRAIATATQSKLEFLSLRCNPDISSDAWCRFYTQTLPNCYSIQSIYNDHVCSLADCDPTLPSSNYGDSVSDGTSCTDISITEAVANAELFLGLNSWGRGGIIHGTYSYVSDDTSSSTDEFSDHTENEDDLLDLLIDLSETPSALYALIRSHPMMVLSLHR